MTNPGDISALVRAVASAAKAEGVAVLNLETEGVKVSLQFAPEEQEAAELGPDIEFAAGAGEPQDLASRRRKILDEQDRKRREREAIEQRSQGVG